MENKSVLIRVFSGVTIENNCRQQLHPANTVFTFIKQDKSGVYMVNANGYEYRFSLTELEKSFANTTKYYYVSDAGNVRATYVNINATADVYRSKIGNMFEDEKSANDKLKKDVI